MPKDIVCGMDVGEDSPFTATYGDKQYYFCSKKCEDQFVQDPLKFVDKSKAVGSLKGTPNKGDSEYRRNTRI